jgi:uncharacterized membrane protein YdfJ with MMPL/SSD domain
MVLTLYGKPIHNAVATSAGVGVPITLAGTLGYVLAGLPHQSVLPTLSIGFVSVIGVLMIAPISSLGGTARRRAWLVEALSRNRLRPSYAARTDALSGQPDRARGMRIT